MNQSSIDYQRIDDSLLMPVLCRVNEAMTDKFGADWAERLTVASAMQTVPSDDELARHVVDTAGRLIVVGARGKTWVWDGDRWALDACDYLLEGVARRAIGALAERQRDAGSIVQALEVALLRDWPEAEIESALGCRDDYRVQCWPPLARVLHRVDAIARGLNRADVDRAAAYFVGNLAEPGRSSSDPGSRCLKRPLLLGGVSVSRALLREVKRLRFDPEVKSAPEVAPVADPAAATAAAIRRAKK